MGKLSDKVTKDFQNAVNTLPGSVKSSIGALHEKKDKIKFKDWKRSILNALNYLDNDYDLGMPGSEKKKQIFKDTLINKLGECPNYKCMAITLKKVFNNKEIIDNIMDKGI